MKKQLEYKSTIKSMPFLYLEQKKAARLKNEGLNYVQIKDMAVKENIFQLNSESRKKEIASMVIRRLKVLDDYLIENLINGNVDKSKQIVIYSIMKSDILFFQFMQEVYREKYILKNPYITDKDFSIYFQRKCEQSEKVAAWKEYTFYKLKQVFIRILFEAGLIKNQKGDREIIRPIMEEELKEYLKEIGDKKYLKAMLGEI